MMNDDLSALANRAAIQYANEPGYLGCTVRSKRPPILAHEFTSEVAADNFRDKLVMQGSPFRFAIEGKTLLEHR